MKLSEEYPVSAVCEVLGLARSTYYSRSEEREEEELTREIKRVAGEWPTYGYRRVTAQLHREGHLVNRKRVQRLMRELVLLRPVRVRKRKTTNSDHAFPRYPNLVLDLVVYRVDQVWVSDITYIRLDHGFVYLAVIMDVYTRSVRGWHLGRDLSQDLTMRALEMALDGRQPEIHHSDQGVQYAGYQYVQRLKDEGAEISMTERGEPSQNGYAERLMRTIKEEEVDLSDYEDYDDAKSQIKRFLEEVYTKKRIHSSLGYLTPLEFERQAESDVFKKEKVV